MSLIQTPSVWERLRSQFKIRDPAVLELRDDVQPTVLVSDVSGTFHASHGYPRNAMGSLTVAAGGAGTQAEAILQGPDGNTGKLYRITGVYVSTTTSGFIQIRPSLGAAQLTLTSLDSKGYLDQRVSDVPPDIILAALTPLSAAAHGTEIGRWEVLADRADFIPLDVTLGNTGFLVIMNGTANEALTCTFLWEEHFLEDR